MFLKRLRDWTDWLLGLRAGTTPVCAMHSRDDPRSRASIAPASDPLCDPFDRRRRAQLAAQIAEYFDAPRLEQPLVITAGHTQFSQRTARPPGTQLACSDPRS